VTRGTSAMIACKEFEYPEEVKERFWLRKLRLADGIDPDDYLDYLFGSKPKVNNGELEDEAGR